MGFATKMSRSGHFTLEMDRKTDNDRWKNVHHIYCFYIFFINFFYRSETSTQQPAAIPAVEPVEQRWEESAGMYTHKKFKKMASSVVVTTVATTPTVPQPHSSNSINVNARIAAGGGDLGGGGRRSNGSPPVVTLPGTTISHHANTAPLALSNITQRNIVIPSHNFPLKHR